MKLYKLTTRNMTTHGRTRWRLGRWRMSPGRGKLCSRGWLHAYESPLVAVMMNPVHGNFRKPRLFMAEGYGKVKHDRCLKLGVQELRLVEELPVPRLTDEERVEVAVRCVMKVYGEKKWTTWARRWLNGEDRSLRSANETFFSFSHGAPPNAACINTLLAACLLRERRYRECSREAAIAVRNAIRTKTGKRVSLAGVVRAVMKKRR